MVMRQTQRAATGLQRESRLRSLLKNSLCAAQSPPAAKASPENRTLIAAVNRCATRSKNKIELFSKPFGPTLMLQFV